MGIAGVGDFHDQDIIEPDFLTKHDEPAVLDSSLDEIYPFGVPEGNFADAPQADTTFDFNNFDFGQQGTQGADCSSSVPNTHQSSFPDQRYVSLPAESQTHPSSAWSPSEQPVQQFQYPDPEFSSHQPIALTPYYPLQPLPSANIMTQRNFRAITPPGQQFSSIDHQLFLHGNMGPPAATAGLYLYEPIQNYQENAAFIPEDLTLSDNSDDLFASAIHEGWALPGEQNRPHPDDLYLPDTGNYSSDADISEAFSADPDYRPSTSARLKKARRSRRSKPQVIMPNGEVKKGRPCAKPQTEERKRVNQRRMEGYYRRKYDQGNLEKSRQQSKESYWRQKQRRIEGGEKVRSYKASKNVRSVQRV